MKNFTLLHTMKKSFVLSLFLGLAGVLQPITAAPEILTYSGRLSQSGQPYSGQAHFKFALLNRTGTFSYWTNDGNFTTPQEPPQSVAATVSDGGLLDPAGQ
jgi:hypothetical protein